LLTRSGLTYPEVSSKVCHDSFYQLGNSVSLPWVIYCEAFYLHVVSIFSCIPVICPKLVLFLIPLQFVDLFCYLSKCQTRLLTHIPVRRKYASKMRPNIITEKKSIPVQVWTCPDGSSRLNILGTIGT